MFVHLAPVGAHRIRSAPHTLRLGQVTETY